MRIKRFQARDMATAMKMVKEELGSEAVILSTREIKNDDGSPGEVEITAGVAHGQADPLAPYKAQAQTLAQSLAQPKARVRALAAPDPKPKEPNPSLKDLEGGLAELKDLILDLTHRSSLSEKLRGRTGLLRLYRDLVDAEVAPGIARSLVERVDASGNGDGAVAYKSLYRHLASLLKTCNPFSRIDQSPGLLALVGPSGVGKTTTLVKLAALACGREQKRVALITLDTYRLGATEQLKTYARIMGLPASVAQDEQEFQRALDLYDNVDLILIDTAGRCFSQSEAMKELAGLLGLRPNLFTMLVLSAGSKDRDLARTIELAEQLHAESITISKIDETQSCGNVINNLIKYKIPVSFLTNGQKVPDDILSATPGRLAELITCAQK